MIMVWFFIQDVTSVQIAARRGVSQSVLARIAIAFPILSKLSRSMQLSINHIIPPSSCAPSGDGDSG